MGISRQKCRGLPSPPSWGSGGREVVPKESRVLNRFGESWPEMRRKPGTDTNFRRSLPEFGCLSQGLPNGTGCPFVVSPKRLSTPPPFSTHSVELYCIKWRLRAGSYSVRTRSEPPAWPASLWQRETQRAENHMRVRRRRCSGRDVPGRPRQIGILPDELQSAVSRVLPERVVIAERWLLKLPVGRRGTREAEPHITARQFQE